MIEAEIPKDILRHRSKVVAGLSFRQAIWGSIGSAAGLFSYFFLFSGLGGSSLRIGLSGLIALPFFLIGFVPLYEQPFEKMAYIIIMENFVYPPKRPYAISLEGEKPKTVKKDTTKPSRKYKPIR